MNLDAKQQRANVLAKLRSVGKTARSNRGRGNRQSGNTAVRLEPSERALMIRAGEKERASR